MNSDKTFDQLATEMTADMYEKLKRSLELGRWPNGDPLSQSQRELCMQAVILYDNKHLQEQERVSYIERKGCKSSKKDKQIDEGQAEQLVTDLSESNELSTVRWKQKEPSNER